MQIDWKISEKRLKSSAVSGLGHENGRFVKRPDFVVGDPDWTLFKPFPDTGESCERQHAQRLPSQFA
jgi:hypothetical protein